VAWLRTVARNRALELDRLARSQARAEVSIDTNNAHEYLVTANTGRTDVALGTMELRERLRHLPPREREIVFLNAAGWRYVEIAERFGISYTRVNQLIVRANMRMREMDRRELEPTSPRGRRLREIENEPPRYITAAIGRPPRENPRRGDQALIREWKRLVLEIEDYRAANGITDAVMPLGREGGGPQHELLRQRIAGYRHERGFSKGIEI
jgi:DNA-binding CsgD family transcriptional regulator